MSGRIGETLQTPQTLPPRPGQGPGMTGTETGRWGVQQVVSQPPSLASLLDNAKEEITFAHSERTEKRKVEDRSVRWDTQSRVEQVLAIQEILERLPDLDRRQASQFSQELRANDGRDALGSVRRRFGDATHAYAALMLAEQEARDEGRPEVAERIAAARQQLEQEEGPPLRAALNAAGAARDASGGDPSVAARLRHAYRDAVGDNRGLAAVYKQILADAGVSGFNERLRFLTRAAGDDLASAGPSVESTRLGELIEDLSTLRVVATAHDRAEVAARRIGRLMPGGTPPDAGKLLTSLLPLLSDGPGAERHANGLPGSLGIPRQQLDASILAVREGREVLALLPVGVFASDEVRQAAMAGLRGANEVLIEREEAQG